MNKKAKSTLTKMENFMRVGNYSERTISTYISYAKKFLFSFNKDAYHISQKEIEDYLMNFQYSSVSQQNQIINCIKLLSTKILKKKLRDLDIIRPRKEKKLPKIINQSQLICTIKKIENLKHKAIISLGFSCGLRVSEVINLKIQDIDSKRMLISINNAKGKKDRIVPLTNALLSILRDYFKQYRPKDYLFNGQRSLKYSANSCNKIVKKYFGNQYHFHQLRHSSFTAMLENGTDISIIQKIAGHNSSKTTQIYTHISTSTLSKVQMPL